MEGARGAARRAARLRNGKDGIMMHDDFHRMAPAHTIAPIAPTGNRPVVVQ
jgi:hypothetical protein